MIESELLTRKQKDVLKFIYKSVKNTHISPTIREIASHFGFSSTGTVRDYLKALSQKGFIQISEHKSRGIKLIRDSLYSFPILGKVQAGLPTLAVEEIEGYLNLDSLLFSDESTFALRVKGDSMIEAGIFDNDLVLVRRQTVAQTGETVVALIHNEATVKFLRKKDNRYYLEPANSQYQSVLVDEDIRINGKVISEVRRLL